MAMLNRTELKALCKLFDQLTEVQAENAIMYSLGATQTQIAEMRHISVPSVKKSLDQILLKLEIYNMTTLRGSTPESQIFPSPQFKHSNQRIQVNHLIAALEGVMPVQQNVLPGHWRWPAS